MVETNRNSVSRYEQPVESSVVDVMQRDVRQKQRSLKNEYVSDWWSTDDFVAPILLTTVLFLVAAILLFAVPQLLWQNLPSGTLQVTLCVLLGMLVSLPVLTSLWMVLGKQTWLIRIPLVTFCFAALLCIFLATFKLLDSRAPADIFWVIGGIALAFSAAIQIPLWIIRFRYGIALSRDETGAISNKQFTIKQLLITTTIFAFTVPVLQWFATLEGFNNSIVPVYEISQFCGIFILVSAFSTLLSVLLVFSPKLRVTSFCLLALWLAVLPFAVVPSIVYVMRVSVANDDLILMRMNVFAFATSNASTIIAVLTMYYALGFRLRRQQC